VGSCRRSYLFCAVVRGREGWGLLVFRVRSCPFLVVVGSRRLWVVGVSAPHRWWTFVGYGWFRLWAARVLP
jgi:hypothetical protein